MQGIPRRGYDRRLESKLRLFPAVVLLGPRQCGKATLARSLPASRAGKRPVFDLERPSQLARLRLAPEEDLGALQRVPGLIVIDQIQREPSLFPLLRALLGEPERRARYLPFFWRTHGGAEVDLLLDTGKAVVPVEVKLSGSPGVPRGLLECMKDLSCTHGFVLHGGEEEYSMGRGVRALPARLVARPDRLCEALRLPRKRPARV
jgi:predicted AAA+ superfamily ATPase